MANIDDLIRNDVMDMIFQALPRHDRLICKEVYPRWYKLLMSSSVFKKDRHIYLPEDCKIIENEPPMSVFMKTEETYEIVTIKDISESDEANIQKFFRHLGENGLNDIHFVQTDSLMIKIIAFELPLIEHMYFSSLSMFKHLKREESGIFFRNLKSVKAYQVEIWDNSPRLWYADLLPFRKLIPEDVVIEIDLQFLNFFDSFMETIPEWVTINISHISIDIMVDVSEEPLLEFLSSFELESVTFRRPEVLNANFDVILSKVQANMIYVRTFNLPSLPENGHKITDLTLFCRESIESLKYLEVLINLKNLYLNNDFVECGFGHDTINLPKVTYLKCCKLSCDACLDNLLKSFKNLKEIWVEDPHRAIFYNWKGLEKMHIIRYKFTPADFESFEDSAELELRHLIIELVPRQNENINLTVENFLSIGKMFPKLEELEIRYRYVELEILPSLEHLKEVIRNSGFFGKLKRLCLYSHNDFTKVEIQI